MGTICSITSPPNHPPPRSHSMEHQVLLNCLISSSPTGTAYFRPVLVNWDVRYPPRHAARIAGQVSATNLLAQFATFPSVANLRVVSDLLSEDWVISASNPTGVTLEDVLSAIHRGLSAPITQHEWECMSPTQRSRVEATFYARCSASRDYERTRNSGVRRIDCLLHTTVFAGLSSLMYRNGRWEVVMTLSRDSSARGRAQRHPGA